MYNNDNNYIGALILKFASGGTLSEEEQLDLNRWRSQSPYHHEAPDLFADPEWVIEQLGIVREFPKEKVWQNIVERMTSGQIPAMTIPRWRHPIVKRSLAAAGITAVIVLAGAIYLGRRHTTRKTKEKFYATLTMPAGRRIVLDTAKPGTLNTGDSPLVSRLGNNTLEYEHSSYTTPGTIVYHQVTVDTGSTLRIHLPDGTWISLSNASTIRYPVTNNGAVRECFLEGKAAFEVKTNPGKPFIVHMGSTSVEVLGTKFNVTAYRSDSVTEITLHNGSLKVSHGERSVTLDDTHLRQARIIGDHIQALPLSDSAVANIMSWQDREPRLHFVNTALAEALHLISLRYGVGIRYKDNVRAVPVTGAVPLNYTLDETIRIINNSVMKIHIEQADDSLIVSAKKP